MLKFLPLLFSLLKWRCMDRGLVDCADWGLLHLSPVCEAEAASFFPSFRLFAVSGFWFKAAWAEPYGAAFSFAGCFCSCFFVLVLFLFLGIYLNLRSNKVSIMREMNYKFIIITLQVILYSKEWSLVLATVLRSLFSRIVTSLSDMSPPPFEWFDLLWPTKGLPSFSLWVPPAKLPLVS